MTTYLPVEWMGKNLKAELVNQAVKVDLALSTSTNEEQQDGKVVGQQQEVLRRFVCRVIGKGGVVVVSFFVSLHRPAGKELTQS